MHVAMIDGGRAGLEVDARVVPPRRMHEDSWWIKIPHVHARET